MGAMNLQKEAVNKAMTPDVSIPGLADRSGASIVEGIELRLQADRTT